MTATTTETETPFDAAERLAPTPTAHEDATRDAWIRHHAATALAAYATFRAEVRNIPPNPVPGSRPELGYLMLAATSATAAAAALTDRTDDAPGLIWDLTPECGALNGEWEDWLTETLVRHGISPGLIDPDLNPADFTA